MRRIAIINQKGGVGKTTTAVNLASALAELGQRVMLIDLDPQAHASLHLGLHLTAEDCSIYHALTGTARLAQARQSVGERLAVVPSHLDLAAAEMELAGEVGREIILRELLQQDTDEFDIVILDCPPSLGVLTLNALTTAGEVLLPMQAHFLSLHGFSKLLKTVELVARRLNPVLTLSGVVFCMYEGHTRLAQEVIADVHTFFEVERRKGTTWCDAVNFETRIRRNIRLAEAPSHGQSIFQYAPQSHGAEDYRNLALEVLEQQTMLPDESNLESAATNTMESVVQPHPL